MGEAKIPHSLGLLKKEILPPSPKVCGFRIQNLSNKHVVLLDLACVHMHVDLQQSINTKYDK
jgi:hypothetical protein